MRVRIAALIMLFAALILCGCRVTGEVENQAYVLALGMDRLPNGRLELTARVPQVGKSVSKDEESSGSGYLLFAASGDDWPDALQLLEQATPRPMNLSHIELLVASEALAREAGFGELIARVAETPHMYTTARFVVCEGRAADFIEAQETVIGTRLSSDIDAMLSHYAETGVIPSSSFAEVCYLSNSVYADPVAIRGFNASTENAPALSLVDSGEPDDGITRSPMRQRYSGTALFGGGQLVGWLDAEQTRMLGLIRGDARSLSFECDGRSYLLTPNAPVRRGVELKDEAPILSLRVTLGTLDAVCEDDLRTIEATLEDEMTAVIRACQALGVDPFGFADSAAGRFASLADWRLYGWRRHYRDALLDIDVSIRGAPD